MIADDDTNRCVVCGLTLRPNDGGLCDKHTYEDQPR